MPVEFLLNKATAGEIATHLRHCDKDFVPPLSLRVDIESYASKIATHAVRCEAWDGDVLAGLIAVYCNDRQSRVAHITSVSVLQAWTGRGIATQLVKQCLEFAKTSGMKKIGLEVESTNTAAVKLYEKSGFVGESSTGTVMTMIQYLESEKHEQQA